ncbi:SurA N-terminal domain-containing protein [Acinetobacter wuhouensis]|uniref:Periplasmic chaperone PpiD n=1 Tax=Acinetobacter wuhouensis TaxID=1879050 RepID=A0A4Q7AF21_9GAMM|nr:SurA N-terminal domain-containing protein [Acinetobacter wuhouensis]RZG43932.1 peptidylprolyl isomerase [Acinetobacter wuhouensis]RZG69472.1 peptidylprolyl isomerase [Acinetobacter wuhouensis]
MESFRTLIRGWFGKVLLVLFLAPFAVVGIEGYFSGGQKEDVAKTVNGQDISKKDLEAQTKAYKDQLLQSVNGDESLLNQSFIQNAVLDNLVARALLIQQADKLGISLSDAQIEQMIAQQPSLQENGQFSQALYANYLRSQGMTSQSLIANLRQDHALKMLMSTFTDYALVSKTDIQQIANLQSEQRELFLSSVKLDDYKANVKVSNQEIADYYNKHQNKFKQVASVDVDYVVLSPTTLTQPNAAATDAELKQAYDQFVEKQNQDAKREVKHIMITTDSRSPEQAATLANEVYAKIQAGTSFAQAAAQYSEDPDSKTKGGALAAYAPGVFGADFDKAVTSTPNGQVSKPVKTQFGYHLIEVHTASADVPSFEAKKAELTAEVLKNKSANYFSDTVNSLNEQVVSSDALDVVSEAVKTVQVQSANGVTLATTNAVLADPAVKSKLFSEDVKNGNTTASSSIQTANGDTVWIKARKYHVAGALPLAQATPRVKALLIEQKAFDAAHAKLNAMIADFKKLPAQQVTTKYQYNFVHAGIFTRSQGLKREIERAAFSQPAPKAGMWSVTTAKLPNELVVVAVSNVKHTAIDQMNPAEVQQLTQMYQKFRGEQLLDDYSRYLKNHAKIK